MKRSFLSFLLVLVFLVTMILLRLVSVSFPPDAKHGREVVYLEEFRDHGNLFSTRYIDGRFYLEPLVSGVSINGRDAKGRVSLSHNDRITLGGRPFLFQVHPEKYEYKQVFRRPLFEIWPGNRVPKYIGGWTGEEIRRAPLDKKEKLFLRSLLAEIEPALLAPLLPEAVHGPGTLLEIQKKELTDPVQGEAYDPTRVLRVSSPGRAVIRMRDLHRETCGAGQWFDLHSGDIFGFAPMAAGNHRDLWIKFNLERVKTRMFRGRRGHERLVSADLVYLVISYRKLRDGADSSPPLLANIKSLETEYSYYISKTKETLFLGERGLYLFGLKPDQIFSRQYIPDNIREGGVADLKELLDRGLYCLRGATLIAVDPTVVTGLIDALARGEDHMRSQLAHDGISWPFLEKSGDPEKYLNQCLLTITTMRRKGSWRRFIAEVEKLNIDYSLKGIGVRVESGQSFTVYYRKPGRSWVRASPWVWDTPLVSGISSFYWGNQIVGDEAVTFKLEFNAPPGPVDVIAVGEYGTSTNGKTFTARHFFDGVQRLRLGRNDKTVLLRLADRKRFNFRAGTAQLTMAIGDKATDANRLVSTDETWESSIDLATWSPVRIVSRDGAEEPAAIWYPENWDPLYRGVKNRYFRKRFELSSTPRSIHWRVACSGDYLIWLNDRVIHRESDLSRSIRPGRNTILVMVSKRGVLKNIRESDIFRRKNQKIFLKHKHIRRSSFARGAPAKWPQVLDAGNSLLAFSSEVNGRMQRFYAPEARRELQNIFAAGEGGGWGLEQVIRPLVLERGITEISLTLDKDWQRIATDCLGRWLHDKKKTETARGRYKNLVSRLTETENRLRSLRKRLQGENRGDLPLVMESIIQTQTLATNLRTEINQIKNHFYEGAVVLMSPRGQILSAAFFPFNEETMASLNGHIPKPYRTNEIPTLNRAWKWKYNPGSTAKILDSISFLNSINRRDSTTGMPVFPHLRRLLSPQGAGGWHIPRSDLKGSRMMNGKQVFFQLQNFRGHNMPGGFTSLAEAFIHSYNTYFGYTALHNHTMLTRDSTRFPKSAFFLSRASIPIEMAYREFPILEYAEKMHMNRRIDLLANLGDRDLAASLNRRPYDAFMAAPSVFPVNAYAVSDVAYCAIGQSDFQLTALQNALVASTVLNSGTLYNPSVIRSLTLVGEGGRPGRRIEVDPEASKEQIFPSEAAEYIKEAMKNVVLRGTAGGVFDAELKNGRMFFAKTGTAETKFYQDNSLFVGFATCRDGSQVVFSVIVPRSGTGAAVAGRLTAQIFREIFEFEKGRGRNL